MGWVYNHSELIALQKYFEDMFECHQVLLQPMEEGFIIHRRWFGDGRTIKHSYTSWYKTDLDRALAKIRGDEDGLV